MSVNIDPSLWGKVTWKTLHYIGYAFPEQPTEEQKRAALNLLFSLANLLPCEKCRQHYSSYLAESPPNVESREGFARYLNELHNKVNERLGKETVAYDSTRPYGKSQVSWTPILIAVVVGILIGFLLKSWK